MEWGLPLTFDKFTIDSANQFPEVDEVKRVAVLFSWAMNCRSDLINEVLSKIIWTIRYREEGTFKTKGIALLEKMNIEGVS